MYTENELQISNKSYTNKDFLSIFPELLDTVKKLTNKWDPSTSNESDPGVVLLKLGAILADKNNYNIDKNILETFPLSVTQRANAWKLYDMLGYSMSWYKAAATDLTITYTGTLLDQGKADGLSEIIIPKYTMFTDDSGKITYTLMSDLKFNEPSIPWSGQALLGTIHDYEVNGVTNITVDNLDSELRLFFTDRMVAQNGIFITNNGAIKGSWERVDNLESHSLNKLIYKFGIMPNTDTCYIQFPQDIGNLIGGGINIKYITTDGEAGNVGANVINSFLNDFVPAGYSGGAINQDFIIKNVASTSVGSNPEDIDEAYRNYKKTIGTFDTLVTLRDYESAIYKSDDGYGKNYVSNVVVSDRTCDINHTTRVIELTPEGNQLNLYVDSTSGVLNMDAFCIGLYVLNPVVPIYDSSFYFNKTFCPLLNLNDIWSKLDDYKLSSHDYLMLAKDDPYIYKNFYTLKGKVTTYYKVSTVQAKEIEDNIKKALFRKYNARNVDFGQPVNYDDILLTILNADTRIKTVILLEPEYELRYTTLNDTSGLYKDSLPLTGDDDPHNDLLVKLLAKMVLSGNVQLYEFDRDIEYKFGQTGIKRYENVLKITPVSSFGEDGKDNLCGEYDAANTSNPYTDSSLSEGYVVKKNLNLLFISPNLYTEKAYTSYVNYSLYDSAASYKSSAKYVEVEGEEGQWSVVIEGSTYNIAVTSSDDGIINGAKLVLEGDTTQEFTVLFNANLDLDNYLSGTVSINGTKIYMMAKMDGSTIEEIKFSWGGDSFSVALGSYYRLKDSLCIYINYTDSNDIPKNEVITGGTIIKFTDSADPSSILLKTKSTISKNGRDYSTLTASLQIDVLAVNKLTKKDRKLYCMWFTNDYTKIQENGEDTETIRYTLFKVGLTLRLLLDNEYFIYTNEDKNELIILGSGTMILRVDGDSDMVCGVNVSIGDVISDGTSAITDDSDWYEYNAYNNNLTFIESLIVTLGEGSVVRADVLKLDYANLSIGKSVRVKNVLYKDKDDGSSDFIPLVLFDVAEDGMYLGVYCGWSLTTKMNIMMGNDLPLSLEDQDQLLVTLDGISDPITITGSDDVNLMSNTILAFSGSEQMSVSSSDENSTINIYSYVLDELPDLVTFDSNNHIIIRYLGFLEGTLPLPLHFSFDKESSGSYTNRLYKIPIALVGDNTKVTIDVLKFKEASEEVYTDSKLELDSDNSTGFIEYSDSDYDNRFAGILISEWILEVDDQTDIQDFIRIEGIFVSNLGSVDSGDKYSDQLYTTISNFYDNDWSTDGKSTAAMNAVLDYVRNNNATYKISSGNSFSFNETYIVPLTDMIDTEIAPNMDLNDLFAANSVWDVNHICNKFTIPQLRTDTLNIKVAPSSTK